MKSFEILLELFTILWVTESPCISLQSDKALTAVITQENVKNSMVYKIFEKNFCEIGNGLLKLYRQDTVNFPAGFVTMDNSWTRHCDVVTKMLAGKMFSSDNDVAYAMNQ